jgi:hypothetical protein
MRTFLLAFFSSCFAFATTQAAGPAEIPFEFDDGFITLEVRVEQSVKPLRMLLDSGAEASVLSLRTARRLRVPLGEPQGVRGVGSEATAYRLRPLNACAGDTTLAQLTYATDLSLADEICSRPIDGLIGVEFFRDRVVEIDYEKRCLRIGAATPAHDAERLPLRWQNGILCAPVGVNGSTPRWTRVDTGCNDALHWVVPRPTRGRDRRAVSIGFVTDAKDMSLTTVGIGALSLDHIETALHGRPLFPDEAGLLGNGILSRFHVVIDWPGQQMFLSAVK